MLGSAILLVAADVFVAPAGLPPLETAVQACTSWIAEPASWADGIGEFPANTGLDQSGLGEIESVPDFALPMPEARRNMHHWQVGQATEIYFITASDVTPVCHVVGGGSDDLFPSGERLLQFLGATNIWENQGETAREDISTHRFAFVADPKMELFVSYALEAGSRTDRPQIVSTIIYNLDN